VDINFSDGTAYKFSGLWLRDACRDPTVVADLAGERVLDRIPFATGGRGKVGSAALSGGIMEVSWADEPGLTSRFDAGLLRQYADTAGKKLEGKSASAAYCDASEQWRWLRPYLGFPGDKAPDPDQVEPWKNENVSDQFKHWDFTEVTSSERANLAFLKDLMRHGVCIVDNVKPSPDMPNQTVLNFASSALGGMQKDPARDDPNWVIQAKEGAQSISYAQRTRLNNHTDQSVPAHGIPALILCVDYVQGQGKNTLVDSYAVSKALRERHPEAYRLLAKYGNNQERDFVRSRVDSVQAGTQGMLITTRAPILQLDDEGNHVRTQFNEVFRTPSTIPYDDFEPWYDAYLKFNDMLHGEEFEVNVAINQGQMLVLNNWRVLHGRAGAASSADRCIMGGTIVREAFVSRATTLMGASFPVPDTGVWLGI
jgi:trimethyllysine dioxygenase